MNTDYMEALARAYKESFARSLSEPTQYVEEALLLVTRQLAVIADIMARNIPRNAALGYLQTTKMTTYTALIALLPKEKAPVPFTADRGNRSYYNYLVNTQIELFSVLDKIGDTTEIDKIQRNESRAFAAIAALK